MPSTFPERGKKQVWKHWTVIKKDKDKKHPRAQSISERMQKHLNKCLDAPDNAKSPEIRRNYGSYINEEEQKSSRLLLNKALTLAEILSSYPSAFGETPQKFHYGNTKYDDKIMIKSMVNNDKIVE
ncbi:14846_t:CDS:2, partial [Gigaspora margarita]